jgi:antitoxin component YwqK of YwqJK toxin-antitoxin module
MSDAATPDDADYENGGPKHRGFSLDGAMHGVWEFYRRDGSLMRSGEFFRGKQVGVWRHSIDQVAW